MHGSDRLQAVLERLDLIKYADIFRKEEIDDGNLHLLTEGRLRGIGIPLGPAVQIMDALRGSRPTRSGSPLARGHRRSGRLRLVFNLPLAMINVR